MEYFLRHLPDDREAALRLFVLVIGLALCTSACLFYFALHLVAPVPRPPLRSEKTFCCLDVNGNVEENKQLPCWQDNWYNHKGADRRGDPSQTGIGIEKAELFMSLVIPAFNEEQRLTSMMNEAIEYLQDTYGSSASSKPVGSTVKRSVKGSRSTNGHAVESDSTPLNWEILVVSDGSTDKTAEIALECARTAAKNDSSAVRIIRLEQNRGKGGAVTHGMRHVRGQYAVFADADGASKFADLDKLVRECRKIEDAEGRSVAVGSRAHLVGSDAVVKRSFLRNFLMHSFHFFLRLLTPPATAAIKDTQCGFKLFSRPSLPYIIPYMHSEGWIFDVEMLMLAEAARIPVKEVPIAWHEVTGSKLNVLWDSLSMAWGLAVLRAAWALGVYKRH